MKKTDRRVKKTEKALAETLSTLLVNKKIQAITIREDIYTVKHAFHPLSKYFYR
ncbi:hypothetical protein EfmJHP36_05860 [Enterococcus faecium]|nr:hypothetical protein EfmJHP36_05860 [Enterococcus faecium]